MTAIVPELGSLALLDFDATIWCNQQDCKQAAKWRVTWKCGCSDFFCGPHKLSLVAWLEELGDVLRPMTCIDHGLLGYVVARNALVSVEPL